MSIDDRDYFRESQPRGWDIGLLPARWILIGSTVLAFLVQSAVENGSGRGRYWVDFHLPLSLEGLARGEFWQVLTYGFIHADGIHMFMNMLGLFLFAAVSEEGTGRRGFFGLYGAGLLGGALGHLAWTAAAGEPGAGVLGASGAVTAVLVHAAFREPRKTYLLLLFLPVPLYLLAALFVGMDVLRAVTDTGGMVAVQAHLGGALAGALWYRYDRAGRRGPRTAPRRTPVRPSILRGDLPADLLPPPADGREKAEAERVDALLERIHAEGIQSLSEEEREFLNRVSRRLRGK